MTFLMWAVITVSIVPAKAAPPKWIDLSHPFVENETIYWPGEKPFQLELGYQGMITRNVFLRYFSFGAGEHGGTHIDAPNHFIEDGIPVDKIKINQVVGDGIVVNISSKAEKNPNAELEISDLEDWEKKHGRMPDEPVVFLYSGWGKFYPDKVKYFGTNSTNDFTKFRFPGLHPNAAKWLIKNRKIKLFGLDTPSLDKGQSREDVPTHKVLLGSGVPGIENVASLHRLPPRGFEVFAAPMKIKGGSGGPCRVFARIAEKVDVNAAMHARSSSVIAGLVLAMVLYVASTT
ncbi:uncharacterized protein LOC110242002 [Exaiptasia diaphana]|uniref:Cyclase n=1 Tax=Exaiptasia diaphana TaxID=2652724 RepID=A0A913XFD1_EXADI|nr:uncharacterized protein LOC110242002 [Exaiptasia diaphana]